MTNLMNYSVYTLCEFLEQVQKLHLDYISSSIVNLCGNPLISGSVDDFYMIQYNQEQLICNINNLSLLGIQGPLPDYYLKYYESSQVKDFLNIFNHRLIQITYLLYKSANIMNYNSDLLEKIISNFAIYNNTLGIYISREISITALHDILTKLIGQDSIITINIAQRRHIKYNCSRFDFNRIFANRILGAKFYLNDAIYINIRVKSYIQYIQLITDIYKLYQVIYNYYRFSKIFIILDRKGFVKAVLNKTQLGRGIYL